ncbi:MAG: hypothetical protein PHH53_03420, partial [Candidatus Nanoarchaeia archaeon]|nr:hypothetical protein [Candidatus Nanoarchaeia archaeon]
MSAIKWAGLPLIVFTCLFVVSFSYAEYTPTPKVDIAAQGATLQAVMKPLIDKTGTDIFIVQPPKQKVQLTLSQVPIEEAIHRSCKATQASWVRLYVMEKPDAPLDLEEFASINKLATDFRSYVFDNLTDEERGQMRGGGPGGQMGGPGGQPGAGGQPQGGGPGGQMGGRAQWNPSAMFEQLDANKDGKLVKDEVPEQAWARIAQSDTDGNGEVTQDEMTKAFEARAATGQGQPDAGGQPGQQGAQGGWAGRMGQTQDPNAVPVGLYQAWRELMQTGQLTREDSDRYSMADVLTDLYGGRRTDPATLKLDNASFDDFRKEVLLKTGFTILGDPESLAGTVSLDLTEKSLDE